MSNLVLACVDMENLHLSVKAKNYQLGAFDWKTEMEKFIEWLKTIGNEVFLLIFISNDRLFLYQEMFESLEAKRQKDAKKNQATAVYLIVCKPEDLGTFPQTTKRDTTDDRMQRAEFLLRHLNSACLCIASGDRDFWNLAETALENGIPVAIAAASRSSLSSFMEQKADIHPVTKERMVYFLEPVK